MKGRTSMNKINFQILYEYNRIPAIFEKSTTSLWDDEHISKGMLEAHLDPDCDAASRKHDFIDASVQWICDQTGISKGQKILDLGCGPGLYAERFTKQKYKVTGIDFSKRSIQYAKEQALIKNLNIEYLYQDYLTINFENEFDLAIMIYCDFGVLSNEDRDLLLQKIYEALKPGGKLIFDVFTPAKYTNYKSEKTWEYQETGYWRPNPYICMHLQHIYHNENIHLEQVVVLDSNEKIEVYRLWDHFYTMKTISEVLKKAGFKDLGFYSDVSGKKYCNLSETLCVIAQK